MATRPLKTLRDVAQEAADPMRDLERAGALILAEMERLVRS